MNRTPENVWTQKTNSDQFFFFVLKDLITFFTIQICKISNEHTPCNKINGQTIPCCIEEKRKETVLNFQSIKLLSKTQYNDNYKKIRKM